MTARELAALCAEEYGTTVAEIFGDRRTQPEALARQVAMYLCRAVLKRSAKDDESIIRTSLRPGFEKLSVRDFETDVGQMAIDKFLVNRQVTLDPKTVANHVEHIYTKIGASTRVGAGLFAVQHGLLPEEALTTSERL